VLGLPLSDLFSFGQQLSDEKKKNDETGFLRALPQWVKGV
jgi:hypothetical protein